MNQRNEQGFPSPFESFDEKQSMLSAICIEGGLAVFALAVGWWANFPPAAKIEWSYNGFLFASVSGIFATIPMLVLYVIT